MKKLLALLLLFVIGSCTTVTRSTYQEFRINSNVQDVLIETSSGYSCKTPCLMKLSRKHSFSVYASKTGYCPVEARVVASIGGDGTAVALAGNAMAGGLLGLGTDTQNGSMNDLKPNPLFIKMEKCPDEN